MRWWDTSALIALLSKEQATSQVAALLAHDQAMAIWWGTKVEGISAIARPEHAGTLRATDAAQLLARLDGMLLSALEVPPSERVRELACRLLRSYRLRAADALQLAAALVWAEDRPTGLDFVCLDQRLREAASREGFLVLPELD